VPDAAAVNPFLSLRAPLMAAASREIRACLSSLLLLLRRRRRRRHRHRCHTTA
jgi:hypothetical protein